MRVMVVLPSESVRSCVNMYGRMGRRSIVACRCCAWVITKGHDGARKVGRGEKRSGDVGGGRRGAGMFSCVCWRET